MPVLTAAAVRAAVLPDLTGTAEDTLIESLIDVADGMIAAHIGCALNDAGAYTLASGTYTLRHPDLSVGMDGRMVWLDAANITAITSIHSDALEVFGADTLVDSDDYTLIARSNAVRLKPSATALETDDGAVKVVATAGWATLPDALAHAVAMLVRHLYDLRRHQGRSSVSEAGTSVSVRPETVPDAVRQILAPYRVRGL